MIALIVAMDKNGLIGAQGALPWHYPSDLKYFKRITQGHTVLMGRKTYESIVARIGGPLPNRRNVVVSSTLTQVRGAEVITDLDAFLGASTKKVYVIGGAQVYAHALPYADRLYITHINDAFKGDTYFPEYQRESFKKIYSDVDGPLEFAVYERRSGHHG